ncbi:MAG TPA: M48 family metalloprotease, partial [bacterium]|nr:M48 family metalloprotease [bacterium]
DELAAVLAHEIGHVQNEHGLKAIKSGRLTSALNILAAESARSFGGEELAELTDAFEGSIGDITSTMMNSGYARSAESEADASAIVILKRVGYDPRALASMLAQMDKEVEPGDLGFGKTHPDPEDRIEDIKSELAAVPPVSPPPVRRKRFEDSMGGV